MLTSRIATKSWSERRFCLRRALSAITAVALLSCYPAFARAQSSPLTVQPSTGRVGVGVTSPQYPLDVGTGTVNAGFFRGDGSQLTNLPGGGGAAEPAGTARAGNSHGTMPARRIVSTT
jgi:hypothetical protein